MNRYKVTHFFSYKNSEGALIENGERMNDNVQAENEDAAKAAHLEMVKANEPNLVEVFEDKTVVELYTEEGEGRFNSEGSGE